MEYQNTLQYAMDYEHEEATSSDADQQKGIKVVKLSASTYVLLENGVAIWKCSKDNCAHCSDRKHDIVRHGVGHLPKEEWPVICISCGLKCQQNEHYTKHWLAKHAVGEQRKVFICRYCDYGCPDVSNILIPRSLKIARTNQE